MRRRPGVGKTTAIREVSRALADDLGKRVIIVDTRCCAAAKAQRFALLVCVCVCVCVCSRDRGLMVNMCNISVDVRYCASMVKQVVRCVYA